MKKRADKEEKMQIKKRRTKDRERKKRTMFPVWFAINHL
jgi:hypothetical protein